MSLPVNPVLHGQTADPVLPGVYATDPPFGTDLVHAPDLPQPVPFAVPAGPGPTVASYGGTHSFGLASDRIATTRAGVVFVISDSGFLFRYATPDPAPDAVVPITDFPFPADADRDPEAPATCPASVLPGYNDCFITGVATDGAAVWVLADVLYRQDLMIADSAQAVFVTTDLQHWTVQRVLVPPRGAAHGIVPSYGGDGYPLVAVHYSPHGEMDGITTRGMYRWSDGHAVTWDTVVAFTGAPMFEIGVSRDGSVAVGSGDALLAQCTLTMPDIPPFGVDGEGHPVDPMIRNGPSLVFFVGGSPTALQIFPPGALPIISYASANTYYGVRIDLHLQSLGGTRYEVTTSVMSLDGTVLVTEEGPTYLTGLLERDYPITRKPALAVYFPDVLPLPASSALGLAPGGWTLLGTPYGAAALDWALAGPPDSHGAFSADVTVPPDDALLLTQHLCLDGRRLFYLYDGYYPGYNVNSYLLCRFGGMGPRGEPAPFVTGRRLDNASGDGQPVVLDAAGRVDATLHVVNACDDGAGGLYAIDRETGDLVQRVGAFGIPWTVCIAGAVPALIGVPVLAWSRRRAGQLVCLHGAAGAGRVTYLDPVARTVVHLDPFPALLTDQVTSSTGTGLETMTDYTYAGSEV